MITFEKQENGVLFTFENSDKYLYGDGTILVPFNSLAVIQDESDMITLRKSASWDIFLSGRFDTDFNYGSKEDAVDALKEALFDETGGVTEEEVEQMIEEATSGIPSSEVVEQLRRDVNAVSGEVDTLQDDVAGINNILTAHTANTNIHVTSTDKSNWDAKQDALTAGENITISGNVISAEAGNNIIELTQEEYDALTEKDPDALYIITDAQEINMNNYATKTDLDEKADASALTSVSGVVSSMSGDIDALQGDVTALSGQVATKVETSDFNAFSAATDARIAEDEEVTAAALNDLAETVSGKQDTLISGENIKTINNISILGSGNITISGGSGGGDYQYYSEDTTNESAAIEVGEQSLTVDGNGVYVNNSPVVTAEELQTIDEKEEVIASALTEVRQNKQDALEYYSEDTENKTATIDVQTDDGLGNRSENRVFVDGGDIIIESYKETDDGEGNTGTTDTQVDINSLGLSIIASSDDGIDTTQTELKVQPMGAYINSEPIATEPYVNAAISGKADTSAVTAAIDDAKAYYISFATLATQGITDNDWDGIVAAIDDHRPIYAGYPRNDGGIIYYGVECMDKNSGNTEIVMTASDNSSHYFYTFTKNGSNDYSYTVSTKPYVPDITTAITSGSTDAQVPTAKAVYDATQGGGGVTVDPTLDTGSTNPVANSAITNALDGKQDISKLPNSIYSNASSYGSNRYLSFIKMDKRTGTASTDLLSFARINDKGLVGSNDVFSLVETSDITTSITSSSTNSEVAGAKAVYDAIQAGGGGGATYSAGTNISIDTGNTISCTLPISAGSGSDSVVFNDSSNIGGTYEKNGQSSLSYGSYSRAHGVFAFAGGRYVNANNYAEMSVGFFNQSNGSSTAIGNSSGNTLFSVGNGTGTSARHNAFEIRQNGDIYVNDGTNDVRLQDTILALGGLKLVKLTQAAYDALATKDSSTLYIISD